MDRRSLRRPTELSADCLTASTCLEQGRTYDIAPDGQRFLMVWAGAGADSQDAPPNRFIVA